MSVLSYVLDASNNLVPEPDFIKHAEWFSVHDRKLWADEISSELTVSTVFLGVSYGQRENRPLVFETAILNCGKLNHIIGRWTTWDEAKEMHQNTLSLMKSKINEFL